MRSCDTCTSVFHLAGCSSNSFMLQISGFHFLKAHCIPECVCVAALSSPEIFIHQLSFLPYFGYCEKCCNAVIRMQEQTSLQDSDFISFDYIPRSGIAGSHDSSILNVLRTVHIVFHSGYSSLPSHRECDKVLFSSHPCPNLLSLVFWMVTILTGVS